MADLIEFTRGDGAHHALYIEASSWSSGGKLLFAAKPAVDDDATDAAAEIKWSWTDSAVTDVTVNGIAYKKYACYFPYTVIDDIVSNGAEDADYLAQFKFVPIGGGDPITFPANGFLDAKVYFNVNNRTS